MTVPSGSLPAYSVDTEAEAEALLTLSCERNYQSQYVARELVQNQTLENLASFGQRLAKNHHLLKSKIPDLSRGL